MIIDFKIMVIVIILVIQTLLLMLMSFLFYLWLTILLDISAGNGLLLETLFFRNALIGSNFYVALICMAHMQISFMVMLYLFNSKVDLIFKFLLR